MKQQPTNRERWQNDAYYRKQIIDELTRNGKIVPFSPKEYSRVVWNE